MTGILLFCAGVLVVSAGLNQYWTTPPPALTKAASCIGAAEVSDLIDRLRPLAKDPNAAWYSNGITLTFYGKGVSLQLKMPNGNEYNGRADTLKEAVDRITEPSAVIQAALKGWAGAGKKCEHDCADE